MLLLLLVVACEPDPPASLPTPTAPAPAVQRSPVVTVVPSPPPVGVDPAPRETPTPSPPLVLGGLESPDGALLLRATEGAGAAGPLGSLLVARLFRSLLTQAGAAGDLAVAWQMSGARATFTIPTDLTWSDGTPLQAAAIGGLLLQAEAEGRLAPLDGLRLDDEGRLEVLFESPACPLLTRLATLPLGQMRWPPERSSAATTVRPLDGEAFELVPDGPIYRPYADEPALRAAWARGDIDGIVGASRLTMGPLPAPVERAPAGPLLATLLFRLADETVGDAALREALTLATDREALYEAAFGRPPAALLTALLPPEHWAAPDGTLPHDRDAARAILAAAGWRDRDGDGIVEDGSGSPLRLVLSTLLSRDTGWEALGHLLAEQWAAVGVGVELLYLEPFGLQERLHDGRWQVALISYDVAADPDQRALWQPPAAGDLLGEDLNVTGYAGAQVAELLEQGAMVPGCRPEDRAPFYHAAWEQLVVDRPLWPLFPLPLDIQLRPGSDPLLEPTR